jgi:hypothetical protein
VKQRALLGVVVALLLALAVPASAEERPTASVDGSSLLEPGSLVSVGGTGWPARTNVVVELCGDAGSSSTTCDTRHGRTVGVGESGSFGATITATIPPKPCPCVIRVSSQTGSARYAIPVEVAGAPVAPTSEVLAQEGDQAVRIEGVRLEREGTFGEWFGAGPRRRLTFVVTNTGKDTLHNVPVEVYTGSSPETGDQVDIDPIEVLEPGDTTTITAPVSFGPLTIGDAVVRGGVGGDEVLGSFQTDTQSFPWGLLVVLLVLLQTGLVLGRNRVRRHLHPEDELMFVGAGPAEVGSIDPWVAAGAAATVAAPVGLLPLAARDVPTGSLERVLWAVDQVRIASPDDSGIVSLVAVASRPETGARRTVAVRAAAFEPPIEQHPWATADDLGQDLDWGDGPIAPAVVDAIGAGRPVASTYDDATERRLTHLASLSMAQVLALPVEEDAVDLDVVVALVAVVDGVTHSVVAELPTGAGLGAQVVMRTAHTA